MASDTFGSAVDIDGDSALVGSPGDDDGGASSGSAYVFAHDGAAWGQQAKLTASDAAALDYFGWSVAISGGKALIGAYLDDTTVANAGSAYLFTRDSAGWAQAVKRAAPTPVADDRFGAAVALDAGCGIAGAYLADDNGNASGAAYAYSTYTTTEDTPLTIEDPGVLANDTDVEGPLTAEIVSEPAHGDVSLETSGGFTYTPDADFFGADSFTYRAYDGEAYSEPATVTIDVAPVDDPPHAQPDAFTADAETTLTVSAPGVLVNDSDPEGTALTADMVTQALEGTATLQADGSFTYRPRDGFVGEDSFTYSASDGTGFSAAATVTITVLPANSVPVALKDDYTTTTDMPLITTAPGVLSNDTDADLDDLTVAIFSLPEHGSVDLELDGSFVYTPDTGFEGIDTFAYRAYDGRAYSSPATVTIEVAPPLNHVGGVIGEDTTWTLAGSPWIVDETVIVPEGVTLTIEPGAVVKFVRPGEFDDTALEVEGELAANGTASDPIVFTSFADDSVAGDSNDDGSASLPGSGDWTGLWLIASEAASISHAEIRYAGNYSSAVDIGGPGSPTLSDVLVSDCAGDGISVGGFDEFSHATPSITRCVVEQAHGGAGIVVLPYSTPYVVDSTVRECDFYGLWSMGPSAQLRATGCTFADNGGTGIELVYGAGGDITDSTVAGNGMLGISLQETDSLLIAGNTIESNGGAGLYVREDSGGAVQDNTISGNTQYAARLDANADLAMSGNVGGGNGTDAIIVEGDRTSSTPVTFGPNGLPYVIEQTLEVGPGASVTLESGVCVKLKNAALSVDGDLISQGTQSEPVVITSFSDDEHGGDTNGDGSATGPQGPYMLGISANPSSSVQLGFTNLLYGATTALAINNSSPTLHDCEVREAAGCGIGVSGAGSAPTITDTTVSDCGTREPGWGGAGEGLRFSDGAGGLVDGCTIAESGESGIRVLDTASPIITGSVLSGNGSHDTQTGQWDGAGITIGDALGGSATPQISGNAFTGNGSYPIVAHIECEPDIAEDSNAFTGNLGNGVLVYGALGSGQRTLPKLNVPYVIDSNGLDVNPGAALTLDPGVVVKFASDGETLASLAVSGATLSAQGTASQPIVITSMNDDAHGGDTRGDGGADVFGDEGGIVSVADDGSSVSNVTLSHVNVYDGPPAWATWSPAVVIRSSPTLTDCRVSDSSGSGIGIYQTDTARSEPHLERVTISGNGGAGLDIGYLTGGECVDCTIVGNGSAGIGIWGDCNTHFTRCSVSSNAGGGVDIEFAGHTPVFNDCEITLNDEFGILATSPAKIYDTEITGNHGIGADLWGGVLVDGSTVNGNDAFGMRIGLGGHVIDTTVWGNGEGGIDVDPLEGGMAVVEDCTVAQNQAVGIRAGQLAMISDTTMTANAGAGIAVLEDGNALLDRCYFSMQTSDSVSVQGGSLSLNECDIEHSGRYGLYVEDGTADVSMSTFADSGVLHAHSDASEAPEIHYTDFFGPYEMPKVSTSESGALIEAGYCYWGSRGGPNASDVEAAYVEPPSSTPCSDGEGTFGYGFDTDCGAWGEPVNTATGNFYYSATDIEVPGVGLPLRFLRTYNSQDARNNGDLGYGWSNNLGISLRFDPDGAVTVCEKDGRRLAFEPSGPNTYTAPPGVTDTLVRNGDGTHDLTRLDRTVSRFDTKGRLAAQTDRCGNALQFTYTSATGSLISRVAAPGGRYLDFAYSGARITGIADNVGRSVAFRYNADGELAEADDLNGETTRYVYDDDHQIVSVASPKHPNDPFVVNEYTDGKVTTQHDAYNGTGTLAYDAEDGITTILNNRGFTLTHEWDSLFRLTSETDGAGNTSGRTYNAAGLVGSVTDANNHTTTLGYDANGNQTSVINAEDHERTASYDLDTNNLLWTEDENETRTTFAYDATDTFLESITTPVGTTSFDYYSNGLLKHLRSADATTTYEYDAIGNVTEVTDPLGKASTFAYDAASRLTTSIDAMGNATRFSYDDAGNMLALLDPLSLVYPSQRHQIDFTYDANGNRETFTDAESNTTRYHYDIMDNLVGVTDAASHVTSYTYDPNYNLASVRDARGNTTTYDYTANDLLEQVTDPLEHTWHFAYDGAGNVTETVYPDGTRTRRMYYDDNMLASVSFDSEPTSYELAYEPTNWLSTVTDDEGRVFDYTYNPVGWLTRAADTVNPGVSGGFATTYAYDEAGRVTGIRPSGEATRTYFYNLGGRPTSIVLPTDEATHTTYSYDDACGRASVALPEGSVRSWDHDAASRPESVVTTTASGVLAFRYTFDSNGNVLSENETRYAYDELSRLRTWYDPSADATTTYNYDPVGNLTSVVHDGQTIKSFSYDAANRISSIGYEYDAHGNMTADPTREFVYDAANRLTAVVNASTETTIAAYEYDYLNRRIKAVEGTSTTYFHYQGLTASVLRETDDVGATVVSYAYDDRGNLHSMTRADGTYYFHTNAHGDVVGLTDSEGSLVTTYTYDPWGRVLSEDGEVKCAYRYAGYRYDELTGLYYLWNRYYSPQAYRFLTMDLRPGTPVNPSTVDRYTYCQQNPLLFVDPEGLKVWVVYTRVDIGPIQLPFTHAWIYSDVTEEAIGQSASDSPWGRLGGGNGADMESLTAGDCKLREVSVPSNLTEQQFMNRIMKSRGWNRGVYGWVDVVETPGSPVPILRNRLPHVFFNVGLGNDCHDQAQRAIVRAGGEYPGTWQDRLWSYW